MTTTARRRLALATLLVLLAPAVVVQVLLVTARRDLVVATAASRAATTVVQIDQHRRSATQVVLTRRTVQAAAAHTQVAASRARLAKTGVSEGALRKTLDDTQHTLTTTARQRADLRAQIHQQDVDLPVAKDCVGDSTRTLSQSSAGASPGPPDKVTSRCRALAVSTPSSTR